jgi:hypothetical protein
MSSQNPQYYRPYYPSDSEEDSEIVSLSPSGTPITESGASTPDGSVAQGPANFAEFAYKLQQGLTAGPTFSTIQQDLSYATNRISKNTAYGPYEPGPAEEGTTQTKPADKQRTSILMIQSRDRDRSIYPQPTFCSLNLPRLYTNIKQFQIAQLSLLSAFYYFRTDKSNILIQIDEQNRLVYPKTNQARRSITGSFLANIIDTTIREGTYSINDLITELSRRLNTPPIFYDYPNGIIDFNPLFQINGDFTLNFNYPGDYFYDSLKKIYISNPSRAAIAQSYFQATNAPPLTTYTYSQVRNAYYYPVIRELVLDTPSLLSLTENQINHIIYGFTGIDDSILASILISDDVISILDTYRVEHTFRYGLVNEYSVTYETNTNRVNITAISLNNSLVNLLTSKYNLFNSQQILLSGYTPSEYASLQSKIQIQTTIFQDMYKFLEVQLASYFGISRGTYSKEYYTNFDSNYFLIQDGLNLKQGPGGVFSQNQVTLNAISTNILMSDRTTQPLYWPQLFDLPLPIQTISTNMGETTNGITFPATSNFPYSLGDGNIRLNTYGIDGNGKITIGYRRRCMDMIVDVDPMKYTLFEVKSKTRQTLQVEVFPRPTQYRVPEYLSATQSVYPTADLFDRTYTFITPSDITIQEKLLNKTIITEIPGFETRYPVLTLSSFGISFQSSLNLWTEPTLMNVTQCNAFYSFQTPYPFSTPTQTTETSTFRYSVNLTFLTSTTTYDANSDLIAFLYHDYGAFLADVTSNRNENPLHYILSTPILIGVTPFTTFSTTLSFVAYAADTYYLNVRFLTISPNTIYSHVVPSFSDLHYTQLATSFTEFNPFQDPTQNLSSLYCARIADSNYVKLPIASTLWGNDPTSDPLYPIAESDAPSIGYDASKVSNDLTDYMPFFPFNTQSTINPGAIIRCDPINNYFFRFLSPYNTDPTVQSYFYPGSKNTIISGGFQVNYTYTSPPSKRNYKIAQWYGTHTIGGSHTEDYYIGCNISPNYKEFSIETTQGVPLKFYNYENTKQTLALGDGVCGFTFLPSDGIWSIQRVTFKSSYLGGTDPNASIQYLGIFLTSQIADKSINTIQLSNAMASLTLETKTVYSAANRLNQGFDAQLGTYYTYAIDPSFVIRNSTVMSGYTQNGKFLLAETDSFYSVIPFSDSNTIANFSQLVGSPVPYPYAYDATARSTFYGTAPPDAYGVVVPALKSGISVSSLQLYGPPPGLDETLSVYEKSIPQGTSILHYRTNQNFMRNPNAFAPWRSTIVPRPVSICASMKGYAVIEDTSIAIVTYPFNTTAPPTTDDREFKYLTSFTADILFPGGNLGSFLSYPGSGYLGCSGNDSCFLFYGAEMKTAGESYQFHVKRYDPQPIMASIDELPVNPAYQIPANILVTQILATSKNGFFLSGRLPSHSTVVLGTPSYDSPNLFSTKYFPQNDYAEIALDPNGQHLYVLTYDSRIAKGTSTLLQYNYPSFQGGSLPTPTLYNLQEFDSLNIAFPKTYSKVLVSINETKEELYFLSKQTPGTSDRFFYRIKNSIQLSPTSYTSEMELNPEFTFTNPTNPSIIRAPIQLYSGYSGARWALFSSAPYIQGNRNDIYDSPKAIRNAWQIFYPVMKLQFTRQANTYTPVKDLYGIATPEYSHSMLFAYSNLTSLNSDIYNDSSLTRGKWGQESNFFVSDAQMNGVYFGGYLKRIPMQPYTPSLSNSYYIALRGYSPTESFQCMVRFYLPNRYDFGFVNIYDLIEEIPLLLGSNVVSYTGTPESQPELFNPTYGHLLKIFNDKFTFSTPVLFGSNDTLQYPGFAISSTGFSNFMYQYSSFYGSYSGLQSNLNNIQLATNNSIQQFISTNLQYILPPTAFNRERFTDPVPFRILWSSCLTPSYASIDDEWGLGWNLGFPKQDTPFGTTQLAPSFFKILDEYIYLKLNDSFNLNRLDKGAKENYMITREATGTTQSYNSKLLLAPFGNYANVIVQNPISFDTALSKMDKLTFTWTDSLGRTINNSNCEWTMSVQITENI